MARSLRIAANLAANNDRLVYLLGAEPDRPDQELGYIVPGEAQHDTAAGVMQFIEKPHIQQARDLIAQGALWNTFILAGSVKSLLSLFEAQLMTTMMGMRQALALGQSELARLTALEILYAGLTSQDFSRDILQRQEFMLQVVRLPNCGWNDLGTPKRVEETLQKLARSRAHMGPYSKSGARYLDLSSRPGEIQLPHAS
jgi:mannose-1-phosphate guanylyltransferase